MSHNYWPLAWVGLDADKVVIKAVWEELWRVGGTLRVGLEAYFVGLGKGRKLEKNWLELDTDWEGLEAHENMIELYRRQKA